MCRDADSSFRIGGDEFVILAEDNSGASETATFIAKRISNALHASLTLDNGQEITVGASIGAAYFPHDGESLSELMLAADQAMYKNKHGAELGSVHIQGRR